MKREIKFRAWVEFEKQMHPVEQLQHRGWIAVPIPVDNGDGDVDWHLEQRKLEDVELMQFIGLHDKNGVEIYEGDVLNLNRGDNMDILVVMWLKEDFSWHGLKTYTYKKYTQTGRGWIAISNGMGAKSLGWIKGHDKLGSAPINFCSFA